MDPARAQLLALFALHPPGDEKEARDLRRMRVEARWLESPFSRSQPRAHFTGSALVVDPPGLRVCLIHHAKLNRWLQPGGHCEPSDGSMPEVALREAREETGLQVVPHPKAPALLDVDIHRIPARGEEPEHDHLDVRFLLEARNPDALEHDPNESHGAKWVPWDEALDGATEPAMFRMLSKALNLCG